MIPVQLSISGFLSYRDPVTLDFSAFDLVCVAGSNGAGKSSLLDAITYALFGKARKTDETIINLQSDTAFVELVFKYETNTYRIQRTNPRGKTTVVEFQIAKNERDNDADLEWKTLTERTVRDTQLRIEETLRLDYETFINAAFFLQGKADQFTQQTPARRKAILSSILGLDIWEKYRQRAVEQRRGLEEEVTSIDGRLAEINAELNQEDDRVRHLQSLKEELDRMIAARVSQEKVVETIRKVQATIDEQTRLVEGLNLQIDRIRARQSQLDQRYRDRKEERDQYDEIQTRAGEIEAAYKHLQSTRQQLAEWDEAARDHDKKRQGPLMEIEKARTLLEKEQVDLQKQQENSTEISNEIKSLEIQLSDLAVSLAEVDEHLTTREQLEAEQQKARDDLASMNAENPRLRAEMDELKARIDQLHAADEQAVNCPVCGQPLSPDQRAQLIDDLTKDGTEKGDLFRANLRRKEETDALINSLLEKINAVKSHEKKSRGLIEQRIQLESRQNILRSQYTDWEEKGEARLRDVVDRLQSNQFAQEARAQLSSIDKALKETGYDPEEHDRIRNIVREGEPIDDDMRKLERAAAALEPLNRELNDLEMEIKTAKKELQSQEAAQQEAAAALAASQEDLPDFNQAQRELLNFQEAENQLRMTLGSAQQNVDVLESLRARKSELDHDRLTITQRIAKIRQLERAFGKDGVPALLIEQAIPQIESKANELLERLSGGEMSVRFQTQRELKTRADLRETLDIIISDGSGTRDYEMYSGGEAFRVNFAIRLALSEILARRAGAKLQTLVIDEGFGSQDETGRQRLIEAINMVRDDFEKILVITHIESLKDAFPTRIEVTKTTSGSKVEVLF